MSVIQTARSILLAPSIQLVYQGFAPLPTGGLWWKRAQLAIMEGRLHVTCQHVNHRMSPRRWLNTMACSMDQALEIWSTFCAPWRRSSQPGKLIKASVGHRKFLVWQVKPAPPPSHLAALHKVSLLKPRSTSISDVSVEKLPSVLFRCSSNLKKISLINDHVSTFPINDHCHWAERPQNCKLDACQ